MTFGQFTDLFNHYPQSDIHGKIIHNSQKSENKSNARQQANEHTRKQTEPDLFNGITASSMKS